MSDDFDLIHALLHKFVKCDCVFNEGHNTQCSVVTAHQAHKHLTETESQLATLTAENRRLREDVATLKPHELDHAGISAYSKELFGREDMGHTDGVREVQRLKERLENRTAQYKSASARITLAESERQDALKLLREAEANVKMNAVVKENKRLGELVEKYESCLQNFMVATAFVTEMRKGSERAFAEPMRQREELRAEIARLKKGEKS